MLDVVVIGGGLAGTTAALSAAAQGARVGVATRGWGSTALTGGSLTLAYTPALSGAEQVDRTLADHVMDIIAHRSRHPFAVLGFENTVRGMRAGYAAVAEGLVHTDVALPPLHLEASHRGLPSTLGRIIPAAFTFPAHDGLDLSVALDGPWGVVQLQGDPYFNARRVAMGWRADAAVLGAGIADLVEVPVAWSAVESPFANARRLDRPEARAALVDACRGCPPGLRGLVFPPVLGLEESTRVRTGLAQALGLPVVEALARMPSVPGYRLQRALETLRENSGLPKLGEIVRLRSQNSRLTELVTRAGEVVPVDQVVLATGRFVAGGVVWEDACREALLGLPVATELGPLEVGSPHPVVRNNPNESHPLMTAGVAVTERLQPVREGKVAFDNLYAAGMVIGGFGSRYTQCGDGVAFASGYWAGRWAANEAGKA